MDYRSVLLRCYVLCMLQTKTTLLNSGNMFLVAEVSVLPMFSLQQSTFINADSNNANSEICYNTIAYISGGVAVYDQKRVIVDL